MTNLKNLYFLWREVGTTLEYRIIANQSEEGKAEMYKDDIDDITGEGTWNIRKVVCNDEGEK